MAHRTDAGRCHRDFARIGFGEVYQLGNAFGRDRRAPQQDLRLTGHACDGSDVAKKCEFEFAVERRVDRARGADHQERVAIRRGIHDGLGGDIGACTRPVFNDERLAEPLLEPLSDQARADVRRTAGCEANHDPHRPRRVGLCKSSAGGGRQCRGSDCQMQKSTAGKFQDDLLGDQKLFQFPCPNTKAKRGAFIPRLKRVMKTNCTSLDERLRARGARERVVPERLSDDGTNRSSER
jgi:hypothetical protein